MELVVAKVEGSVDWLEWFKVDIDFPFLSFRGDNFTTVDDKAIGRDLGVKFETLLGRSNGRQDGETIDTRFDVGGGSLMTHVQ